MDRHEKLFAWLTSLTVTGLIISNLLAIKLTNFFGIAVDCGILLYPITYVVGDLMMEFCGRKRSDFVLFLAALLNVFVAAIFVIATHLPAYPGWENQLAFATIFNFGLRVILASSAAFLLAGILNNFVFEKIRRRSGQHFVLRAIGSSLVAKVIDVFVFEFIAFFGVLSLQEFLLQAAFAYLAGVAIECVLFLIVTKPVRREIANYLQKKPLT